MRNVKYFYSLLLLSFFLIIGCQKDQESVPLQTNENEIELRQIIRTDNTSFTPCEARKLTAIIPDCLEEVWVDGIHDALLTLNNVSNASVNIRILSAEEIANGEIPDFVFECSPAKCNELFDAFFPSIQFGFAQFDPPAVQLTALDEILDCCNGNYIEATQDCFFKGVVMHEILHLLGFEHDGDFDDDTELVEGTPEKDPNSIMNKADGCNVKCELSDFDILALQTLFEPCICIDEVGPCECPTSDNYNPCACAPESYSLKLVPGPTICAGELAKIFISPAPPTNINATFEWTFEGAVTGNGGGASASFVGNTDSHRPLGGICVTITTDCEEVTLCESVFVKDCDGDGPGPK